MSLLISLHLLAAVIWVGGMFFAYMILRPAAGALNPPERLALWSFCFGSFFIWVWMAIATLLITGYVMLFAYYGGFGNAGVHIHLMHVLGWLMFLLFGHVFFAPWRRMRQALAANELEAAAAQLNRIRLLVAINLGLGLLTVVIASGGQYIF